MPHHFVLTTFGSLGDVHPYIAVGLGLKRRGHRVTIATSANYRPKIEGEGLIFFPVRPDLEDLIGQTDVMKRAFHPRTGSEYIIRHLFLPWLEQSFEDLLPVARDADLLVGHPVAFAIPTVAEILRKPWVSVILQPSILLSAFDPPVISGAEWLRHFRHFGPWFWRGFFNLARRIAGGWGEPINRLRAKLGLATLANPVLDDMFSPYGKQAWFSKVMARPQPDWPRELLVTGFPFYDRREPGEGLTEDLRNFLERGDPPVVFTLGSSVIYDAGTFYQESVEAIRRINCRAVLLTGGNPANRPRLPLPDGVTVAEYAPYSELFSRAAAIVHQGGVGTTAQALRSGRPMIVVPWTNDQPDNAMRAERLGVSRTIPRSDYRQSRVARELSTLLGDASYAGAARRTAEEIASEDGVECAGDALEKALRG